VIRRSLNTSASIRPVGVHNFRLHTGSALNIADYIDYYEQHGELKDNVSHTDYRLTRTLLTRSVVLAKKVDRTAYDLCGMAPKPTAENVASL